MSRKPVVETDRLLLREFGEDDVEAYYRLGSDPEVTRYTGTGQLSSIEHALQILRENPLTDYRRDGFGRWACVSKANGEVIGFAGLKRLPELGEVDIGYWLLPAYWGAGLATEAGRAALDYGFGRLKLPRIIGLCDPANRGSIRVLEKLGMTYAETITYRGDESLKYVLDSGQQAR